MQWWSLFVMCFSHLSILLKHFSVLKMRHVEKYSKTGILNFNARHNITPDKGQKMCTFPQMLRAQSDISVLALFLEYYN